MLGKVGDIEAKANLQSPFYIREIEFKCLKSYCPSVKKNKEDANWKHRNETFSKDKVKDKSHNASSANQLWVQASKRHQRSWQKGATAIEVYVTKIAKKNNDKAKDLSHVKCYTCKQKSHYASKYLKKPKN